MDNNQIIKIPKSEYDRIIEAAKKAFPEEACGLIAGIDENNIRFVRKVYVLQNIDHSREHFSLSPKEQLAAIQDMRKNKLLPLGNWHSHPTTPSRPSEEDKRLAFDKRATYMILSLADKEPILNAFHIENNESRKEVLEIIE